MRQIIETIRTTEGQFICILDSRCEMSPADWLEQLINTFDETVAQVGPQIRNAEQECFVRGALLGTQEKVQWNTDHAVRCHLRSEWLEVDGLPWLCVVFRRQALLDAGLLGESLGRDGEWAEQDLWRRLNESGWQTLCNQNVTATHPLTPDVRETLPRS